MTDFDDTLSKLREHVGALDPDATERIERTPELLIICGDDGTQIAFRGTCPKCAGHSWIPAGRATVRSMTPAQLAKLREILNEAKDSDAGTHQPDAEKKGGQMVET